MPNRTAQLTLVAVAAAACGGSPPAHDGLESYREALGVVERALEAMGGSAELTAAGGITVAGEGEYDLGVRGQGMRWGPGDAYALDERLAVVPGVRTVYESRGRINPDAEEWMRRDIREAGGYWINMAEGWSFPTGVGDRSSYERLVPHLLLEEARSSGESLASLGRIRTAAGFRDAVRFRSTAGVTLTLLFDTDRGLLREVEYLADLPLRGDTRVRWSYGEYRPVEGVGFVPSGYSIDLGDDRMQWLEYTRVSAGLDPDVLALPDGVELPPLPAPTGGGGGDDAGDPDNDEPEARDPYDIRELAEGVYIFLNLRGGFHMLFVEFDDFVLAVDAPTEWNELHRLPGTSPGDGGSQALSRRYLDGIRSRVPDKPVRYVVLTHQHSDHAGGVRAFADAGATVVGTAETRPVATRAVNASYTLSAYEPEEPAALRYETVAGTRTIEAGDMEVRLIDVGENPHVEGMLVVYLPRQRILYVADLFDPSGPGSFPSPSRVPVMRWFVDWLDGSGLEPERIYAVHGSARVTETQLETIRALKAR